MLGPFVAGMDTVANTLAFMLYALLEHPDALERVRQDAAMLLRWRSDGSKAATVP